MVEAEIEYLCKYYIVVICNNYKDKVDDYTNNYNKNNNYYY